MASKQLRRSKSDGIITGLCAGIGDYFNIDPWIVRIIFIVSAIGFIPYLILSIFIPSGHYYSRIARTAENW